METNAMNSPIQIKTFEQWRKSNLADLKDQELLQYDFFLHHLWDRVQKGENDSSTMELIESHLQVKKEMEQRQFKHLTNDGLSDEIEKPIEKDSAQPGNESIVKKESVEKEDDNEFPNIVLHEEDAVKFYKGGGNDGVE